MANQITVQLPAMYGDHHVVEVRRLLLAMDGVLDVYASSAFGAAEITYDPQKTNEKLITEVLEKAGYTEELAIPVEKGAAALNGGGTFFRKTAVFEQTRSSVTFGQHVGYSGRPLWNCPGIGVVQKMED